jgi:hypothetical protein
MRYYMRGLEALLVAAKEVIARVTGSVAGQPAAGSASSTMPAQEAEQQALAQQLQVAVQEPNRAEAAALPLVESSNNPPTIVLPLLEPAERVAALVEAFYQQPEQRAATALELARAAATRSCANLQCPNVGGEGREAEGRVNQRCSACRALRYCCRECSVVDWRAGHRRVCGAGDGGGSSSSGGS